MSPRSTFGLFVRGAAVLAVAALGLTGCIYEPPIGPPTVLVTAAPWPSGLDAAARLGAAFSGDAAQGRLEALSIDFGGADVWTAGAIVVGQCEREGLSEGRIPGALETVAERFSRGGFECGAFLSGDVFDEQRGALQGCVMLDEGWLRAAAGADAGPLGAMSAGVQYAVLRAQREAEDTPFVWIHLDLSKAAIALDGAPVGDASATLDEALAHLAEGLAGEHGYAIALVNIDSGQGAAATAAIVRSAGPSNAPGSAPVVALAKDVGERLWQARALAEVKP